MNSFQLPSRDELNQENQKTAEKNKKRISGGKFWKKKKKAPAAPTSAKQWNKYYKLARNIQDISNTAIMSSLNSTVICFCCKEVPTYESVCS